MFVDDYRDAYGVKRLCQVLGVNRSSYYKWLDGAEARAARERADLQLAAQIRAVHHEADGAYGAPRVTAEQREGGMPVNEKKVARVMRKFQITGIRLRRRVRTTVSEPSAVPVADLFSRDFTAAEPGAKYMGDIEVAPGSPTRLIYAARATG
jgi:transposase InsO family protein